MENESFSLEDILAEFGADSDTAKESGGNAPASVSVSTPEPAPKAKATRAAAAPAWDQEPVPARKKESGVRKFFRFLAKLFLFLLETVLLVAVLLYGVMYVLAKGPSPTARDLFVMSVRETSAMYWLADLYFTEAEIAEIESGGEEEVEEYVQTDTSLITIDKKQDEEEAPAEGEQPQDEDTGADEWGLVDEDGDGIIVEPVKGEGYSGYMMVVLDPSRVIMGSVPSSYGGRGYTVADMVEKFDAVAGINAGGFEDPDGKGNGSIPDTMTVFEGKVYYESKGVSKGFVGFDSNYIMHVGNLTSTQIQDLGIQYGVSFGPVLIQNGEPATLTSGLNPRTAIGQRSDGAVLMLVIDGRQAISMGATYQDLIDIFVEYGAVNACNLDGGSSTLMWFEGDYINNCASVIGIRPVPTTFLVMKEGATE